MKNITDYTHKNVKIKDIRLKTGKNNDKFFSILVEGIDNTLHISYDIFNERIKSFFLGKRIDEIDRSLLLTLNWNFIITQGYFYKVTDKAFIKQESPNKNKFFVSILDIVGYDYQLEEKQNLADFSKSFGQNVTIVG
jgi:hypothetical protein